MSDLPWLIYASRFSLGTRVQSYRMITRQPLISYPHTRAHTQTTPPCRNSQKKLVSNTGQPQRPPVRIHVGTYLVEVYYRLPELVLCLVEVSHSDLSKVSGMVLVKVGSVVMLTTSHTASTGMLAVLSDTTVTGGDMTAAVEKKQIVSMVKYLSVV